MNEVLLNSFHDWVIEDFKLDGNLSLILEVENEKEQKFQATLNFFEISNLTLTFWDGTETSFTDLEKYRLEFVDRWFQKASLENNYCNLTFIGSNEHSEATGAEIDFDFNRFETFLNDSEFNDIKDVAEFKQLNGLT